MKPEWNKLSPTVQKKYEDRAKYLVEKGYIEKVTVAQLAQRIYEKSEDNG